jgi:hypothetical protein
LHQDLHQGRQPQEAQGGGAPRFVLEIFETDFRACTQEKFD